MKGIRRGEDGGRMKHTWISSNLMDLSASCLLGLDSRRTRGQNRTVCEAKMQPWKRTERVGGVVAVAHWPALMPI
jgi:hypothetical protein